MLHQTIKVILVASKQEGIINTYDAYSLYFTTAGEENTKFQNSNEGNNNWYES